MPWKDFAWAHRLSARWAEPAYLNADPAGMMPASLPAEPRERIAGIERVAPQA